MKIKVLPLCLLGVLFCLLDAVRSQGNFNNNRCTLGDTFLNDDREFPDIEVNTTGAYIMTVENTSPALKESDYYVEYYDSKNHYGRVDAHQEGENLKYIYKVDSWEAWNINIREQTCQLNNVTDTPGHFRFQSDWTYEPLDHPEKRVNGPSAMFKQAREVWLKENNEGNKKDVARIRTLAFTGELFHNHVRGEKALVWRWCQTENISVDFFFATEDISNAYNAKVVPLRVLMKGGYSGDGSELNKLSEQSYDILSFQPYITPGSNPFEIPIGLGCGRAEDLEKFDPSIPDLPTFDNNVFFDAEVIYRRVHAKSLDDIESYYSNFRFARDTALGKLAFTYSSWNLTKKKEIEMNPPVYNIFDLTYDYYYKVNIGTGKCDIDRVRRFTPSFLLPKDYGVLDLNNPYIFFPNSELPYLTRSHDRGVEIDVFEDKLENYLMSNYTFLENVIATHTYLRGDQKLDNIVSVKHAPLQAVLKFSRDNKIQESLTFNFYGFTTKVEKEREIFDLQPCFKNDDEYAWITIGFQTADGKVSSIEGIDAVDLEYEVSKWLETEVDIDPIRVPKIIIDIQDELYVKLLLLGKPTLKLDFVETQGVRVDGVNPVVSSFDTCAKNCLENESDKCWGIAMCGTLCYTGKESKNGKVDDKDCILYERFDNRTYMKSKERLIANLAEQIQDEKGEKRIVISANNKEVTLEAVSIEVTNPSGKDDSFDQMKIKNSGRVLIYKEGMKLKNGQVLGKVGYEECQRLCLDYKDCESFSYCLMTSECSITPKYGEEIAGGDMVKDTRCRISTRKYADNFEVNPGFFVGVNGEKTLQGKDIPGGAESCSRFCLKETGFQCLSFDLCGGPNGLTCQLHTKHFLKAETRKQDLKQKATCRHYTRKYSVEFKKSINTKVKSQNLKPLTNLNLEECAKTCKEYAEGACFAFDYCPGKVASSSTCYIIDSDPSRLGTEYSAECNEYLRGEEEYAPHPYTNSYAAGIGVLCFIIAALVGVGVVFGIAYIRVNRS